MRLVANLFRIFVLNYSSQSIAIQSGCLLRGKTLCMLMFTCIIESVRGDIFCAGAIWVIYLFHFFPSKKYLIHSKHQLVCICLLVDLRYQKPFQVGLFCSLNLHFPSFLYRKQGSFKVVCFFFSEKKISSEISFEMNLHKYF